MGVQRVVRVTLTAICDLCGWTSVTDYTDERVEAASVTFGDWEIRPVLWDMDAVEMRCPTCVKRINDFTETLRPVAVERGS